MSDVMKQEIGGKHYNGLKIQPIQYIFANNLGFIEGNIVKYITRYKDKNKNEDIEKIIHYAKLLLKLEYGYTQDKLDSI